MRSSRSEDSKVTVIDRPAGNEQPEGEELANEGEIRTADVTEGD